MACCREVAAWCWKMCLLREKNFQGLLDVSSTQVRTGIYPHPLYPSQWAGILKTLDIHVWCVLSVRAIDVFWFLLQKILKQQARALKNLAIDVWGVLAGHAIEVVWLTAAENPKTTGQTLAIDVWGTCRSRHRGCLANCCRKPWNNRP